MTNIYILASNDGNDAVMTREFEAAIDWLTKRNSPDSSVLEYHLGEKGIEASWNTMWYIKDGEVTYMNY